MPNDVRITSRLYVSDMTGNAVHYLQRTRAIWPTNSFIEYDGRSFTPPDHHRRRYNFTHIEHQNLFGLLHMEVKNGPNSSPNFRI